MKMRSRPSLLRAVIVCLVVLAISPSLITPVSSVAVMSVDLGSEWMKIAVVTVAMSRFSSVVHCHD